MNCCFLRYQFAEHILPRPQNCSSEGKILVQYYSTSTYPPICGTGESCSCGNEWQTAAQLWVLSVGMPCSQINCRNTQCAKSRSVCTFAACWKNCVVSSTQQRQQTKIQLSFYSPKTTNQTNNLEQFTPCQNTDLKSFLSFTHQYKHCVFSQTIQTWTHRTTVTNVNESARDRSQVYGTQSVNVPHLLADQKSLKAIYVIMGWNCGTHYSEAAIWWCFQMPKKRCGSTLDHIN